MPDTISSVDLKARDARVDARIQADADSRIRKKDAECRRLRDQLFETKNLVNKLVDVLGFTGQDALQDAVWELKYYQDTNKVPGYKALVRQWSEHQEDKVQWTEHLRGQTSDMKVLSQQLQTEIQSYARLCYSAIQLLTMSWFRRRSLQLRFDELKHMKERADERYRRDYDKWRDFKIWLLNDNQQKIQQAHPGDTDRRKAAIDKRKEHVQHRRDEFHNLGIHDLAPFQDEKFLAGTDFLPSLIISDHEYAEFGPEAADLAKPTSEKENIQRLTSVAPSTPPRDMVSASNATSSPAQPRVLAPNTSPEPPSSPHKSQILVPDSSPMSSPSRG